MNMGTWGWRHWRRGDTVTWRQWGCSDTGTSWGRGGTGIVGMGGHGDGGMEGRRDGGTEGWGDGGMGGRRAGGPWRCITSAEQPMGAHAVPTDGAAPRPLPERLLLESVGRRRGGLWGGRDGVGMRGHDGDVALRDVVVPPPNCPRVSDPRPPPALCPAAGSGSGTAQEMAVGGGWRGK